MSLSGILAACMSRATCMHTVSVFFDVESNQKIGPARA
jgi:hypothetical protein